MMWTDQLILEQNNRVFAVVANAGGASKYKILFFFKFPTNNLEPRLFSKLFEQPNTNANQDTHYNDSNASRYNIIRNHLADIIE